ncbi:fumarylacetoacetate hydrolase family protein [Streptomyces xanthophaeus]|uniref:fumarylacetoacetate hydrolase family protein n=1 Tax=Streptomyces xanthophaeus TaxID=67385 RepID=UPI00398FE095
MAESAAGAPARPAVFTKYPTSPAGPHDAIELPSALVDWEVELVAVIGDKAHQSADAARAGPGRVRCRRSTPRARRLPT